MRRTRRLARLGAASCAALALAAATGWAAVRGIDEQAPMPVLSDDASGPLFSLGTMRAGEAARRCITVTNEGPGPALVRMFGADRVDEGLAGSLGLTVVRGTRPAGGRGGSCAGFAPDAVTYGYGEPGVVYRGTLAEYAPGGERAITDPAAWQPGERHTYAFAVALDAASDDAVRERRLTESFAFEADAAGAGAGAASASRACAPVRIPDAGAARGRLVKQVAVNDRVAARLIVRAYGSGARERLVLTTGLRVRGRTLLIPRWAAVRYTLDGHPLALPRARPFRTRVPAGALRTGTNVVGVSIRRAGAQAGVRAAFRLDVRPAAQGGRKLC